MAFEYAKIGIGFVQSGLQYLSAQKEASARKAMQKYTNRMVDLSNAASQNTITENEIQDRQSLADQAFLNKRAALEQAGTTEVAAAAAGVEGNSVNSAMFDVTRQAAMVEGRRQLEYASHMLAFDTQRTNTDNAAVMQKDNSILPSPSVGNYLFSAVANSAAPLLQIAGFGDTTGSGGSGKPKGKIVSAKLPAWYTAKP